MPHREREDAESEYVEQYLGEYASVSSIVKEALPFELVAVVGGIISGVILSGMTNELEMIPGLIVIIPGIMGLRGNISSTLGSRLGSAIHMGLITKIDYKNRELTNNIVGSMILTVIISIFLGFLGHFVSILLGFGSAGLFNLILISLMSGFFSGLILSFVSVYLSIGAFRFGFDPDNVVTPSIATIGDIISVAMIFIFARLVLMI
ncbi:magnesium transporter [Methanimicrococcus sp. OttesenSCG-928-J09]|nr:magnesium transporter [Methanimicrococcus sp. OttesenSCG-928-J09]